MNKKEVFKKEVMEVLFGLEPGEVARTFGRSLLSDTAIKRHQGLGNIIIDPFDEQNLGNGSYDVSLGEWYFREQPPGDGFVIYNPYSQKDVERVWGKPQKAKPAREQETGVYELKGVDPDEPVIWVHPQETILCHTHEFIGGTGGIITTMMKARSSWGRNFITVCKCAGWGDVGYVNRWTMEITNGSRYYPISLVGGRRLAQIAFFEVEPITRASYSEEGKYQTAESLEEIKAGWKPEMMLPRMFADREARAANKKAEELRRIAFSA